MATAAQISQFIAKMAPLAQSAYKSIGKVLPSVCIGMACVESAYGTSQIMASHNAYFGQKVGTGKTATRYWSGKAYSTKTKEEYTVGTHTTITAAFRAYDDAQQCVNNFYELLNTKLYARVTAGADYKTQMQQVKACGYMTSSTEVNSVIRIIETYGLTKYDAMPSVSKVQAERKEVNYAAQVKTQLNVRGGPGTSNKSILVLPKGMVIAICEEQGNWGRLSDIDGWVSLNYVQKET